MRNGDISVKISGLGNVNCTVVSGVTTCTHGLLFIYYEARELVQKPVKTKLGLNSIYYRSDWLNVGWLSIVRLNGHF